MAQVDIEISQKQALILARAIYSDVAAYIKAHQEEYQKFLEKENGGTAEDET